MLMTNKKIEELERVSCIRYPVSFKNQTEVILDPGSDINARSQAFAYQLDLKIWKTNVKAQKIDGTTLETHGIVFSIFSVLDKDSRKRFFEESFLLADVKPDIIFGMPFLTMSNADIDFQVRDFQLGSYTTGDVFWTTRSVKRIEKNKFAAAAFKPKYKVSVV